MLTLIHRSKATSLVCFLLIAYMFSFAIPANAAHLSDSDKSAGPDGSSPIEAAAVASGESSGAAPLGVAYTVYNGAIRLPAEPPLESASRPRSVARLVASVNEAAARPIPLPPASQSPGVISTAPMTAGEKFESWFRSHFLSPGAYGKAVFNGMWKELQDNDDL